ncbi:MAG: diphosphomevalonate decarboxylase [Gammaproteobacteria bacterium]|nr:MAG: diphosphomevalonate decarboxylase [Gammaproteobacteria bacterium]
MQAIFRQPIPQDPKHEKGLAFAPTNIALVKYWGKRDVELNLPVTSSLSIALLDKGAMTTITLQDQAYDTVVLNNQAIPAHSEFAKRISQFLDLFRPEKKWHVHIDIKMNIPAAAGLASSACGFASLMSALNDLFNWQLTLRQLSILARLGSGSAARSFWTGFVEWHAGVQPDGMDSVAEPLAIEWPMLRVGLLTMSEKQKPISSREAMQRTVDSSILYSAWPKKVMQDLAILKQALHTKNFSLLGGTAESNALTMHATMLASWPAVCYFLPETIAAMHQIWALRQQGMELYFTQDAGPNLKLLFLETDTHHVKANFPTVEIVKVFE